jgi:hypothetical protein
LRNPAYPAPLSFLRISLALFVAGTASLAFLVLREYRSLSSYCEGSFEVSEGGDRYSCLEPYNWFAIEAGAAFALILELGLLVLVVVALVRWRRTRPG